MQFWVDSKLNVPKMQHLEIAEKLHRLEKAPKISKRLIVGAYLDDPVNNL